MLSDVSAGRRFGDPCHIERLPFTVVNVLHIPSLFMKLRVPPQRYPTLEHLKMGFFGFRMLGRSKLVQVISGKVAQNRGFICYQTTGALGTCFLLVRLTPPPRS